MLKTGISNSEYHSGPELSSSIARKIINLSPKHVRWMLDNPRPKTPAFAMGGCLHGLVLEPSKVESEFGEKPDQIDGNGPRTNAYKEAFAEMEAQYPEKQWLSASDYDTCCEMAESCLDHPVVSAYLAEVDAIIEGSGYFTMEGADCRIRPDYFLPDADVVIDLKSTMDGSKKGFASSVRTYGYAQQACFYMEGLRMLGYSPKQFIFVAVEKKPPYVVSVYSLRGSDIDRHREDMRRACQLWTQCKSSGIWPGYSDSVETLDLSNKFNSASVTRTASMFGVSRPYVYKIIEAFQLETRKIGNEVRVDMHEFANAMRWFNEGKKDEK